MRRGTLILFVVLLAFAAIFAISFLLTFLYLIISALATVFGG